MTAITRELLKTRPSPMVHEAFSKAKSNPVLAKKVNMLCAIFFSELFTSGFFQDVLVGVDPKRITYDNLGLHLRAWDLRVQMRIGGHRVKEQRISFPILLGDLRFVKAYKNLQIRCTKVVFQERCLDKVIGAMWEIAKCTTFRPAIAEIYEKLLKTSRDLNVQHKGWSLLHYCTYVNDYLYSDEDRNKTFELMRYLIRHGANVNLQDQFGRTPLFFHSGERRFSDLLLNEGARMNPRAPVQPSHVVSNLMFKKVRALLEAGADPYGLDIYGRMPLHCVICCEVPDLHTIIENIKCLLEYAPFSTEYADRFGYYPLTYAIAFGDDVLIDLLFKHTSTLVISIVMKNLKEDRFVIKGLEVNEELYQVADEFVPRIGGGPKRGPQNKASQKKCTELAAAAAKKTEEEKTYKAHGKTYYLHADKHGIKHTSGAYRFDPKKKREFIRGTSNSDATFYPEIVIVYTDYLARVIKKWANRNDPNNNLIEFRFPVGADAGKETNFVELYYGGETGSHMRPKDPVRYNSDHVAGASDQKAQTGKSAVDHKTAAAGSSKTAAAK
jgi:hypothetical protein